MRKIIMNIVTDKDGLIRRLLYDNQQFIEYIKAVRTYTKEDLWIGGGFIRSIVWNYMHNKKNILHKSIDVDIFYFQTDCILKEKDVEIEQYLHTVINDVNWSVKNQARMHVHHKGEDQYKSLEDALLKFPDTASTVAVKMDNNDVLSFIAPYGFNDLFDLKVNPTPSFATNPDKIERYEQRIKQKRWQKSWPNLKITHIASI